MTLKKPAGKTGGLRHYGISPLQASSSVMAS